MKMSHLNWRSIGDITIATSDTRSLFDDEYDTGVNDGSGELVVQAESAEQTSPTTAVFRNVQVGTSGSYSDWDDNSLRYEASNMLERDYFPDDQPDFEDYEDDDPDFDEGYDDDDPDFDDND